MAWIVRSYAWTHKSVHSKAGSASVWPGFQGVLQGTGGGEHPRQLCDGVRADGWGDGLRLPPDDWQQNPSGVRDFTSSSDERGDKCSGARHNWLIDLLEGLIITLLFCLYSPSSSVEQSCIMRNPSSREQQASHWNERLVIFHMFGSRQKQGGMCPLWRHKGPFFLSLKVKQANKVKDGAFRFLSSSITRCRLTWLCRNCS